MKSINETIPDEIADKKKLLPQMYTWGKIIEIGLNEAERLEKERQAKECV